jgi:hypothetical protein
MRMAPQWQVAVCMGRQRLEGYGLGLLSQNDALSFEDIVPGRQASLKRGRQ